MVWNMPTALVGNAHRGTAECSNKDPMTTGSQHFSWTSPKNSPLAKARESWTLRSPVESLPPWLTYRNAWIPVVFGYQAANLVCCCNGLAVAMVFIAPWIL